VIQTIIARRGDLVAERDPLCPSGRLLRQGGMDASYVDLADPSHLEFDYMRWLRIVLRACHARRVLHVGGAACALPRALAAADPGGLQEVCEVDGEVLAFARDYLGLRRARGLRVRHSEGRAFAAGHGDPNWDAIVLDAFLGAVVPRRLITVQAAGEWARVAPLALINVVDDRQAREVRLVGAALATAYACVWTLGARAGNTIVIGGGAGLDFDLLCANAAADRSPPHLTAPAEMACLISGTSPLRDEEIAEVSPASDPPAALPPAAR
jgi:hypothetical protein